MVINGKEISEWVDLVSFENNDPYLLTGLVDAILTQNGAMYDGQYGALIVGQPGNQYLDVDLLNDWTRRSQERYQQRVNLAKNAFYEFSSRLENLKNERDDSMPYERRVIGIAKQPILYRCEDGGISSMVLMKTVFSREQAKYICGWTETYTVQTREVTAPKSGDFFDYGSSRVVSSKNEYVHHGGIWEDENYYYLKPKTEEERKLVLLKYGPEYGVYMDPASRIYEGYKAEGSHIERSLLYTMEHGYIMPVKQVYRLSITPERIQQLLSNRGQQKMNQDNRKAVVGCIELAVAALMMLPFTLLVKAMNLAGILSGKLSWIAKYLLGIFPGLFNAKIWPPVKIFTYGGSLLKDMTPDGQWLVAFWLAVPISITFGLSFLLWMERSAGAGDVVAKIFKQIFLFLALLLVYPIAIPLGVVLTCYQISHQIILRGMAKHDIKKRKKLLARVYGANQMGGVQ